MSKKVLSVLMATLIMLSSMCVMAASTASAAVTSAGTIYLEVPASWKTYSKVFCHLWLNGGEDLYAWQTRKEQATKVSDGIYSYDIPEGANVNMVIWSNDIGMQTYDLTMGEACLGDTCYSKGEIKENPVDSEKTAELLYWRTHVEYGPKHLVSSIGTEIGVTDDPEAVVPVDYSADDEPSGDSNNGTTAPSDADTNSNTNTNTNDGSTTVVDDDNTTTSNTVENNDVMSTTDTGDMNTVVLVTILCAAAVVVFAARKRIKE